jgi:hypothetical protein
MGRNEHDDGRCTQADDRGQQCTRDPPGRRPLDDVQPGNCRLEAERFDPARYLVT